MSMIPAGLLESLPDELWPDSVTLEQPDDDGEWQEVAGLTDLDCRIMVAGRGNANESQTFAIEMGASHVIELRAYKPLISFDMRANVNDGTYYEIVQNGIRHAAQTITSLAVSGTDATAM